MTPISKIEFADNQHKQNYSALLARMRSLDEYHEAAAYLISLDAVCRDHQNDLFDLEDDSIIFDALRQSWQTGTSMKVTRLLFNLWNGCCTDGEQYKDSDGYEVDLPSEKFTVDEIFCCGHAPYFWQAVKLRFPQYVE